MNPGVIDASVVARWFIGDPADPLVERALVLRAEYRAGRLEIHGPELLPLEVANAVWKQVRFAGLAPADGEKAVAQLLAYEMVLHPHSRLASDAFALAIAFQISVYDAAYVALARKVNLPFWTLDQKLARAVADTIEVRIA